MYDAVAYGRMVTDTGRMSAYARALEGKIIPGQVILDLGSGPGIMALVACRAGAARVYAVEPDDVIQIARASAVANNFADRIHFIQALSGDVDLPERVDGIVSDIRGVLPMFRTSLVALMDARDRFLKPTGWLVSERDTVWAALVSDPILHDLVTMNWKTEYGFRFSSAASKAQNQWRSALFKASDLIVEPQCWYVLHYPTLSGPNAGGQVRWTIQREAVAHGACVWFDTETAPGIGFSNSPLALGSHIYQQAFFPWPKAVEFSPGDQVTVSFRAAFVQTEYIWTWDTRITHRGSRRPDDIFHQSTLQALSISRENRQKRAHAFVPELSQQAKIDRRVVDLMAQSLSVGEIAQCVWSEFPNDFKDFNAALTRVGDLSEKYSELSEHNPRWPAGQ